MTKSFPAAPDNDSRLVELVEIKPIIVGGSPTDPDNKTWLTRAQHILFVRYWNAKLAELRKAELAGLESNQ
jgi:hypothetical protein